MPTETESKTHAEALRSTSLIGGSTAIAMLVRMIKTKALALMLGPAGIGLEALFDSTVSLIRTIFDLGISSSGVREIAAAVGTRDERVISTTVYTLRRSCLVLGILAAATLFFGRAQFSEMAFKSTEHATDFGCLSLMLILASISGGQSELLQGMRRIRDLAKVNIIGAISAAALSIPIVYYWGKPGIPAYMLLGGFVSFLSSWWYSRRVKIERVKVALPEVVTAASSLLKLGLAFMASSLFSTGALYLIRNIVSREVGIEGTGQFQAANALSMVYVGFILQAMGTDFYPRLTAVAHDNAQCCRTVNEQAEISLLLALPGILGTLACAPWVMHVFYSGKFAVAADILTWQATGMLLRVISWPMGFIIMAKGRGAILMLTEFAAYAVYVAFAWLGLKFFGLIGTGMAFLGLYIFHALMINAVVRKIAGFRWSSGCFKLIWLSIVAGAAGLAIRLIVAEPWATIVGFILTAGVGVLCLKRLTALIGPTEVRRYFRKIPIIKRFVVAYPAAPS
ncbi:MAG TPA: O-antigen translocase [Opitutaceae bacterium]|nr:O-antigen translocase [Opitutaceae bacterium]